MTRKLVLVFLCIALTLCAVQDITQQQLDDIRSSSKIWLVYGSSDKTSAQAEILQQVSEVLTGFFRVGLLPVDDNKLRVYGDDDHVAEFSGDFTVDKIVAFVLDNTNAVIQARSKVANQAKANKEFIQKQAERAKKEWDEEQQLRQKSNTIVLDAKTWQSTFLKERQPYLINFYQANCSVCIELNREWEAVSTHFKGKMYVAKINMTESQSLESQVKLSAYPSIRFYPVGTKNVDKYYEFDGIKKKFSIVQWATAKLSQKLESVDIAELNKQNYKTMCKQSKSTCVIVFTDNPNEVQGKIGELAAKYLEKPINFLVSKKGSQPDFEAQVGVVSAPDTVMMYCKGKKFLRMEGLDFKVIDQVINQITLGNRNNFIKYKFDEQIN